MAWAWKPVDGGFTVGSGLRDSRVATGSDSRPRPRRGTRARGQAVCRTDTVQRPTLIAVSSIFILHAERNNKNCSSATLESGPISKVVWISMF